MQMMIPSCFDCPISPSFTRLQFKTLWTVHRESPSPWELIILICVVLQYSVCGGGILTPSGESAEWPLRAAP